MGEMKPEKNALVGVGTSSIYQKGSLYTSFDLFKTASFCNIRKGTERQVVSMGAGMYVQAQSVVCVLYCDIQLVNQLMPRRGIGTMRLLERSDVLQWTHGGRQVKLHDFVLISTCFKTLPD